MDKQPEKLTIEQATEALNEAKSKVVVGGTYEHYKNPDHTYTVNGLAINEATQSIFVLYEPNHGEFKGVQFSRALEVFLEEVDKDGGKVQRFKYVEG